MSDLPVEEVQVSVYQLNTDGSLSYLSGQARTKNEHYVVYFDYDKHATVIVPGASPTDTSGVFDVGVAIRVQANLTSNVNNLNLGSLFAIGVAADSNKVVGSLQMSVIGLENQAMADAVPIPTEISDSSIASVIAAMSTIKSKIYDQPDPTTKLGGTTVVPLIIAESVESQVANGQLTIKN